MPSSLVGAHVRVTGFLTSANLTEALPRDSSNQPV